MDMKQIEKKWQKIWADTGLYKFDNSRIDKKYYVLEMFSYPSGAKLHAGHWFNYGLSDSFARFKRMQGYEVFQPMGFDAFGLPAENYAIKTGIHPKDSTEKISPPWSNSSKPSALRSTGTTSWSPAVRNITNGRNGCFWSCINTTSPTAKRLRSTGALPATRCSPTNRSSTALAKDATPPS